MSTSGICMYVHTRLHIHIYKPNSGDLKYVISTVSDATLSPLGPFWWL